MSLFPNFSCCHGHKPNCTQWNMLTSLQLNFHRLTCGYFSLRTGPGPGPGLTVACVSGQSACVDTAAVSDSGKTETCAVAPLTSYCGSLPSPQWAQPISSQQSCQHSPENLRLWSSQCLRKQFHLLNFKVCV